MQLRQADQHMQTSLPGNSKEGKGSTKTPIRKSLQPLEWAKFALVLSKAQPRNLTSGSSRSLCRPSATQPKWWV